ncbi:phage baseplate assembly protein V [Sphingobium yanoikuyae]|uniref:phage baseplate assembly protein V n=1 Tax=Sphingobium yanoikuyae TaxID=13690 RepID=UPI0026F148A8|nr:phage baseplate assembly protein V [Sphingobium yanoikuyae]
MMVGRAVLAAVDDSTGLQSLQVDLLADETQDAAEHFQPYGYAAHPKPGAEAIALAVGGLRGHGLVITVADRRYRVKGLQEGEVAVHDDQGQVVLLGREGIRVVSPLGIACETDGDFSIRAGGDFSVTAEGAASITGDSVSIDAEGATTIGGDSVTIDADGDATLRAGGEALVDGASIAIGEGASLFAARKTDTVSSTAITGGSSKVKIA